MDEIEIKKTNEFLSYENTLTLMKSRVNKIKNNLDRELIWFLSHDHIYTQGTSSSDNDIVKQNHIKILKTNRGGKTTYHGPGQRIIYFLINLNNRKKDIRNFVNLIENSLIEFLSSYNIEATSFKDRVGIWVTKVNGRKLNKEEKIGAIGLRVTKWITYHGLSFNIDPNLKYYDDINACGLKNYKNTSLKKLGTIINQQDFDVQFEKIFLKNLRNFY